MEKQIVLREPIKWKMFLPDGSCYNGYDANDDPVLRVEKLDGKWVSHGYFLGSVIGQESHGTLDKAMRMAEKRLTDWLRSIATITE